MPLRLSTNRLRSLWPIPERDFTSKLKLVVICLFDANIPGDDMENFKGGTTGGSILEGMLRVGDKIEVCKVLSARTMTCVSIVSLCADKNVLQFSVRDGIIGVVTGCYTTVVKPCKYILYMDTLYLKGSHTLSYRLS